MSKFHENVLELETDNNSYAIHRRNIAGIAYRQMVDKSYTLWFHLIKPLCYDSDSPPIRTLALYKATHEVYLECVLWLDNSLELEIKEKI